MEEEVKSDEFGPLNVFYPNRSNIANPGGILSDYNEDGSRRPDEEDEEDEEEPASQVQDQMFPPFNKENERTRGPQIRRRYNFNTTQKQYSKNKQIKGVDHDGRFSISENCYILYGTIIDDDGDKCIYINLFQCEQKKGYGRMLMNMFLHNYLKTRNIPLEQNIYILLKAVTRGDQLKLNQYYKDIGFQQLDRLNNFKANINDVLYFTYNYKKNANGFLKKTRSKPRGVSKRRMKSLKKRRNTIKNK